MQVWTAQKSTCQDCGEEKEARAMFSSDLCRVCHHDAIAQRRAGGPVIQVTCTQCKESSNLDTFKVLRGTSRAVCGSCARLSQPFAAPAALRCGGCAEEFIEADMLDNATCVYCAVRSRDREQLMRLAWLMRSNPAVYAKVSDYIYGTRRTASGGSHVRQKAVSPQAHHPGR